MWGCSEAQEIGPSILQGAVVLDIGQGKSKAYGAAKIRSDNGEYGGL